VIEKRAGKLRMGQGEYYESSYSGLIFLDKEGNWFYDQDGSGRFEPITHELTVELFSRSVEKDPEGGYRLVVEPEWARIIVEDTPYMVRRTWWRDGRPVLLLNDRTEEDLKPETLWIGKDNVLYCMIKDGQFPARFLRPAYYGLLMEGLVEKEGEYFLKIKDHLYQLIEK
jgi:hypothetical protein